MRIEPADSRQKRSEYILDQLDKLRAQAQGIHAAAVSVRMALLGREAADEKESQAEAAPEPNCFFDELFTRVNELSKTQATALKELERVALEI